MCPHALRTVRSMRGDYGQEASHHRHPRFLAAMAGAGAVAAFGGAVAPADAARHVGHPMRQLTPVQISAAPNSYIIGNVEAGGKTVTFGKTVRDVGPGHRGTPYYRYARIGGSFDHCGWIQDGPAKPVKEKVTVQCGKGHIQVDGSYPSWFRKTFTDGQLGGGVGNGAPTTLNVDAPQCRSPLAYGNADPWKTKEVGANPSPIPVSAHGTATVDWRYVTKSGQYVMVHGPNERGAPNWYFVARGCLPRTL